MPAIVRTVRRDMPGTVMGHNTEGRFSNRKGVTRSFVFHVATTASARSSLEVTLCVRRARALETRKAEDEPGAHDDEANNREESCPAGATRVARCAGASVATSPTTASNTATPNRRRVARPHLERDAPEHATERQRAHDADTDPDRHQHAGLTNDKRQHVARSGTERHPKPISWRRSLTMYDIRP
jgi:hypothetical protein